MNSLFFAPTLLLAFAIALSSGARAQSGLFQAGSKHLYIHCEGQRHGSAVVLDAGLFRESTDWKLVIPEIAKFTQVCSYDREGLGRSTIDKIVEPESECIDESAEDVRLLMKAVNVPPPYVLIGASGGGIRVRRYTRNHPDEVAGLVFVDSAHEEQIWRFQDIDSRSVQGPPADPNRAHCGGMLPAHEKLVWHYDKPLIVLEHGIPMTFDEPLTVHTADFNAAVDEMTRDLASRSSKGELRIAHKSNHEIMLDEPAVVVQAVHDVWTKAQKPTR